METYSYLLRPIKTQYQSLKVAPDTNKGNNMNIGDIYWGTADHEFHPIVCIESPQGKGMYATAILSSHPHDKGNITNVKMEEGHFVRTNPSYSIYVDETQRKQQYLVQFKWLKDIPSPKTIACGRLTQAGMSFVLAHVGNLLPQRVLQTLMDYDANLSNININNQKF